MNFWLFVNSEIFELLCMTNICSFAKMDTYDRLSHVRTNIQLDFWIVSKSRFLNDNND